MGTEVDSVSGTGFASSALMAVADRVVMTISMMMMISATEQKRLCFVRSMVYFPEQIFSGVVQDRQPFSMVYQTRVAEGIVLLVGIVLRVVMSSGNVYNSGKPLRVRSRFIES